MATARGTGRQAYWRRQIEAQGRSGLSRAAFCAQQGLRPGTLSFWKWKLAREAGPTARAGATMRRRTPPPAFVPVQVAARTAERGRPTVPNDVELELRLSAGRELRLRGRVDPGWLVQVLRGLEGTAC